MNSPTSGIYVYRSAMACSPTCTTPMTGTSVPTYQSHPTAAYGRFRAPQIAIEVMANKKHDRAQHLPER